MLSAAWKRQGQAGDMLSSSVVASPARCGLNKGASERASAVAVGRLDCPLQLDHTNLLAKQHPPSHASDDPCCNHLNSGRP